MVDRAPQTDLEQEALWQSAKDFFEGIMIQGLKALDKLRTLGWGVIVEQEGSMLILTEPDTSYFQEKFPREIRLKKERSDNGLRFHFLVGWDDPEIELSVAYNKEHFFNWLSDAQFYLDPDNEIALKIVGHVKDDDSSYSRTISVPFHNSAVENYEVLEPLTGTPYSPF